MSQVLDDFRSPFPRSLVAQFSPWPAPLKLSIHNPSVFFHASPHLSLPSIHANPVLIRNHQRILALVAIVRRICPRQSHFRPTIRHGLILLPAYQLLQLVLALTYCEVPWSVHVAVYAIYAFHALPLGRAISVVQSSCTNWDWLTCRFLVILPQPFHRDCLCASGASISLVVGNVLVANSTDND